MQSAEGQQNVRRPLSGVKVLSFEVQVAGPYCSMMLADQGADVVKVERPGEGDAARYGAPIIEGEGGATQSGYFLRFNRNKRSVTVDLKSEEGRQVFRDLARGSDVLIENYRPGLLSGMELGYSDLAEVNPRLIYASITGFGSLPELRGRYSDRTAYDIVAQAMGGTMYTNGQQDGPPTWPGIALGDIVTGMHAAQAITLALYDRERTGRGTYIDIAMYDSMVALSERSVTAYSLTGRVLERGVEPFMAPWGPFQTKDGWVALIVATERDWHRFCDAIDRPDLKAAEGATSGPERARSMTGALGAEVRGWIRARETAEVLSTLESAGLPVGVVQNAADVLGCDHLAARRLFVDVPDPVLGSVRLVGPVAKTSDRLPSRAEPAPALGQHTDEVLAELGYSRDRISALHTAGAV